MFYIYIYTFFITEEIVPTHTDTVHQHTILKDISNKTNLLKNGDIVYITGYVDMYNIFVRKVIDNNDELKQLLEDVHTYSLSQYFSYLYNNLILNI